MPKPRTRDSDRLTFTVSTARTLRLPTASDGPPLLPWPVAAIGGGVVAGLAGLLLVAGVVLVAWLSAIAIPLPTVLDFAARVWLLAHGGVLQLGEDEVTLVPLGLTLGLVALCAPTGRFAYRQGRLARTEEPGAAAQRHLVLGSIGQVAGGYTVFAAAVALAAAGPAGVLRPTLGALVLSAGGSAFGVVRAAGYRLAGPAWVHRGLRGAAAGLLGLVVAASVVLGTALVLGEQRVASLEQSLGLDGGGVFVWSLVTLAYLPTLLGWALAWLLGAGFTVGTGSVVSLSGTQLGMLPAIPAFGALPPVGAAPEWLLLWLAVGAAAGVLAGVVAVRGGRTSVLGTLAGGGVAGGLTGLAFLAWAAASRGGLGSLRLVGLGPRLVESVVIGVPLLLVASLLGGLGAWLVRRWRRAS